MSRMDVIYARLREAERQNELNRARILELSKSEHALRKLNDAYRELLDAVERVRGFMVMPAGYWDDRWSPEIERRYNDAEGKEKIARDALAQIVAAQASGTRSEVSKAGAKELS